MDGFLDKLAALSKEDDQYQVLAYVHSRLANRERGSWLIPLLHAVYRSIIDKSTADDLKWIVRLIDKDLRIKVGPKYVLGGAYLGCVLCAVAGSQLQRMSALVSSIALHPDAFEAYRNSANLADIITKVLRYESLQDLTPSQMLGTYFFLRVSCYQSSKSHRFSKKLKRWKTTEHQRVPRARKCLAPLYPS